MSNATNKTTPTRSTRGFTLIEVMMVVVIIGVLAALAIVGYQRHLRTGRLVAAQEFISRIQAREETYFQQWGFYVSTSPGFFPALASGEPQAKAWTAVPAEWVTLGARPENDSSYFAYTVVGSDPAAAGGPHALDATAPLLGVPAQPAVGGPIDPHPWYYVIGHGDLDGDASYSGGGCGGPLGITNCTIVAASSARAAIILWNEGE